MVKTGYNGCSFWTLSELLEDVLEMKTLPKVKISGWRLEHEILPTIAFIRMTTLGVRDVVL